MDVNITAIAYCLPKGFNHRNWVNHYFNGGGSPGVSSLQLIASELTWPMAKLFSLFGITYLVGKTKLKLSE